MATTKIRPPAPAPKLAPRRRRFLLAAAPWALAGLLGGAVAWAVPQAREAERLSASSSALDGRVRKAEVALEAARNRLAAVEERLANAREQAADLAASKRRDSRLITELEARVQELEAAAAAEAAEAAPSSEAPPRYSIPPPPPPPPPPTVCPYPAGQCD